MAKLGRVLKRGERFEHVAFGTHTLEGGDPSLGQERAQLEAHFPSALFDREAMLLEPRDFVRTVFARCGKQTAWVVWFEFVAQMCVQLVLDTAGPDSVRRLDVNAKMLRVIHSSKLAVFRARDDALPLQHYENPVQQMSLAPPVFLEHLLGCLEMLWLDFIVNIT